MFFRRQKTHIPSFTERLDDARKAGFTVQPPQGGKAAVLRGEFAAIVAERPDSAELIKSGVVLGKEVGVLTDLGFQKIFATPSGAKAPATAQQLHGLHDFVEDLREALGLTSFYNQGLGSTNTAHVYDRVEHRDDGHNDKPWQQRPLQDTSRVS